MNDSTPFVEASATWKRLAERVAAQHWPAPALYVVATPIGNLGDLGLRAWQALQRCDVIAAEDTRSSRPLLDAWGIATPMMAAHRHNEAAAAQSIVRRLETGERVALISDAGAPAVSDPGARIVRSVRAAGFPVVPVPGASAVIAALMASGATSDENPAYCFAGFPPPRSGARQKWLRQWCAVPAPVVLFESPHRVQATVEDMLAVCGADRRLTIARELTKRFEQIETLYLHEAFEWLGGDSHRRQGEFVLILHEGEAARGGPELDGQAVALLEALLETLSLRDAVKVAVKVSGAPRDALYALALELGKERGGGAG
ncbi:16S rRNA (cytidine(1402)-2'-O)-methyltransferase [Alcaligenaceae bacterium]|nr:16S rRNA (cytidine(1402)-2'-O)-methyltransferase [Alcaligenaceae bacterium]